MPHDFRLDVKGTLCPIPVIKAKKMLAKMSAGQKLLIETTDPVAQIDIPHMCNQLGFTLLETAAVDGGHKFLVQK
ncbi:tRNA 2-thiouridine synthesizing protein A [Rhodobacter viridis]|uniref:tRNA 2-thiouridine synthesizing protein A n=2 Tax=Rhodobacter viridis TaxID=1054202 RepID=A0A318U5K3_9RHOB|nr:sulfurtransferase TusA family protein [Rhodobacter viridis]PYF07199.1 tRNA 2-thiouridine synthesizing protein A [Rhodobacter viridis]